MSVCFYMLPYCQIQIATPLLLLVLSEITILYPDKIQRLKKQSDDKHVVETHLAVSSSFLSFMICSSSSKFLFRDLMLLLTHRSFQFNVNLVFVVQNIASLGSPTSKMLVNTLIN